jgi:1-acyl-sn-glycerol-3-phosphate acyltransferase
VCLSGVCPVRIEESALLVSFSFQSSPLEDTRICERSFVQYLASAGELGGAPAAGRVAWPIAVVRALRTTHEALECAREIRRRPSDPTPTARATRLVEACARLGRRLRLKVDVHGQIPNGPSVIVANHVSYLDPLAIGWTLPVGAVAKSEIMSWPGVGEAVADLGIVFVKRGCSRSGAVALRRTMRLLDSGVPVLVFPEGTTTTGHDVLPFSRGAFGVARFMRVPVVPAALRYDNTEVPWVGSASLLPHALKLHRHNEIHGALIFGPSLEPMAFADASALAEATRQCIRSLLLP